jgi:hypothetical protein
MIVATDYFHQVVRKLREIYNRYLNNVNKEYTRALERAKPKGTWGQPSLASTDNQYNLSAAPDLFICPYNKHHVVRRSRRKYHIYKCKRNAVEPSPVSPTEENWDHQPSSTVSPIEENWIQQPSPPTEENRDQQSSPVSPIEDPYNKHHVVRRSRRKCHIYKCKRNAVEPSPVSPIEEN